MKKTPVHYYVGDCTDGGGSLPMTACRPKGQEGVSNLCQEWQGVTCKKCLAFEDKPVLTVNDGYWAISLTCHGTREQANVLYARVSKIIKKMNLTCVAGDVDRKKYA